MEYEKIDAIRREEAEKLLASGVDQEMSRALLASALHDPDANWVQERCLLLLDPNRPSLAATAVACLGHLARIHRRLDLNRVLPALELLRGKESLAGVVEDALDDIEVFISRQQV